MSESRTRNILVGSVGTGSAFAAISSLRRQWDSEINIIGTDINPEHLITSSLFVDSFENVPYANDPEFEESIIKLFETYKIDTYIPFVDQEVFKAAQMYENSSIPSYTVLQIKNSQIVEICSDKLKAYNWMKDNGILTPKTSDLNNCFESEKYILKPRSGFGSKVEIVDNDKIKLITDKDKYIIQEICDRPEITVDVCFSKNHNYFKYICRERIEVKSGVCTKARLFYDDKIKKIAYKIASTLDLVAFCFQVMDLNGEWYVTDINPRLGAGTAISVAAGMDFFSAMFAILWELNPSKFIMDIDKEVFVTRQYSEFVMN